MVTFRNLPPGHNIFNIYVNKWGIIPLIIRPTHEHTYRTIFHHFENVWTESVLFGGALSYAIYIYLLNINNNKKGIFGEDSIAFFFFAE